MRLPAFLFEIRIITTGMNDIDDQPQARRARIDDVPEPIGTRLLPTPPQYGARHRKKIAMARRGEPHRKFPP